MVRALFDDHYEAFPTWREAGLKDLVCLHVDAHLDVMEGGFTPTSLEAIATAETRDELEPFRCSAHLPGGGFHCGNYLLPALLDGTVTELIWLLPRHVLGHGAFLDAVRAELAGWVDLTLEEYSGLQWREGRVVGTLKGRPFTVCTSESLPELTADQRRRLALDIDVDYFVRASDDKVWQTPFQLREAMRDTWGEVTPVALTVAYSCDGGYTPLEHRYLGEVSLQLFGAGDESARAFVEDLVASDDLAEPEQRRAAWEAILERTAEPEYRAAVLYRSGRLEEAVSIESAYREEPLNRAARRLEQKRFQEGYDLLGELPESDLIADYLKAYLLHRMERHEEAVAGWSKLLTLGSLEGLERSLVLRMNADSLLALGRHREAINAFREADRLEPGRGDTLFGWATAQQKRGQREKAIRTLRRALRAAQGRVSSLPMLLEAARLYEELGQAALARASRRQLRESDVTGRYTITSLLEHSPR